MYGGKFNESIVKNDVEWACMRAREIPGPGQYDHDNWAQYSPLKLGKVRSRATVPTIGGMGPHTQ